MQNLLNDTDCIAQLLRLGLTEGAQQHFDWRYTEILATEGLEQAELLAEWYRAQTA